MRISDRRNSVGLPWWSSGWDSVLPEEKVQDGGLKDTWQQFSKKSISHSVMSRIPGTEEPGGLPSMGSHRVRHDWCDLAATAACLTLCNPMVCAWNSLGKNTGVGSLSLKTGVSCIADYFTVWAPRESQEGSSNGLCLQDWGGLKIDHGHGQPS